MIGALRSWFYRGRVLKPQELPAFVVSVGNISMGGTGKSPFSALLCEWALGRGISAVLLTRGYKRKKKKLEIVPAHGDLPAVESLGDEPWMIKNRLPGISLLVHGDRARMAGRHWNELGAPRLVVLDDGFQHWRALRDRDVVMLDATESLDQRAIPFGNLREPAEALARADLVVITRASAISSDALFALKQKVQGLAEKRRPVPWKRAHTGQTQVIAADYAFEHFFRLDTGVKCGPPEEKNLVVAAGVAKPDSVRRTLKTLGLPIREEIYFPDHHQLSAGDLERLKRSLQGAALLLTEKDWARWRLQLNGLPGYGFRVRLKFFDDGQAILEKFFREVEECSTSG